MAERFDQLAVSGDYGASSGRTGTYGAEYAFTNQPQRRWQTVGLPAYVWQRFSSKHVVAKFSVSNRQGTSINSPKAFHLVASNDCSTWVYLLTVPDAGFTQQDQSKTWTIPTEQRGAYFCYGLNIMSSSSGSGVALRNTQFFRAI